MGWRGTVILTLLVLVAGAYVWLEDTPLQDPRLTTFGDAPEREPTQTVQPLVAFEPADVLTVHLEHDGKTREARRDRDTWKGTEQPGAIDDFLHNLTQLGLLADIPASPADLKDYGLLTPQSVVRLGLRDRPAPLLLQIGDRNPATTGVYVRLGENGSVVLAGALIAWEFDKAFAALGVPATSD